MKKILGCLGAGLGSFKNPFASLYDEVKSITSPEQVAECHSIILWGGADICPVFYGEQPNKFSQASGTPSQRDIFEWLCLTAAVENNVNIIGVCRGAQLICVFSGGSLAQDISFHHKGHPVAAQNGESFFTNGDHHQMMLPDTAKSVLLAYSCQAQEPEFYIGKNDAINTLPTGFKVPEAVYFPETRGLGFQWHPEWMESGNRGISFCLDQVKTYLHV